MLHRYSKANKITVAVILLLAFGMGVSIKYYFRIYHSHLLIYDFAPNFIASVILTLTYYLFESNKKVKIYFIRCVLLLSLYEISQVFDINATFDFLDIVATFTGSYLTSLFLIKHSFKYE